MTARSQRHTHPFPATLWHWLGSMPVAVFLLVTLALVLAFATRYESLYNTKAAQRVFYHAWWFQTLLGLLAVNLTVSALHRWPWKKHHIGFVLTHVGIILILIGGLIGTWWGVEGQLIIPEGQTERFLHIGQDEIIVHVPNPGNQVIFPVHFASRALEQSPRYAAQATIAGQPTPFVVDRYLPNARVEERVETDGTQENPAIEIAIHAPPSSDDVWLFARDPERFGMRWGEAHLFFIEPATNAELHRLLEPPPTPADYRGVLRLAFPRLNVEREIAIAAPFDQPIPIKGTPYRVTIKEYFPDFAITEQGVRSRSDEPNNPALAFVIADDQGGEPHLAFALHPDFEAMHKTATRIPVTATYVFDAAPPLPPALIGIVKASDTVWHLVMTSSDGTERQASPLVMGHTYTHPWLGYAFRVAQWAPRARLVQEVVKIDDEVKHQAIHVRFEPPGQTPPSEAWVFYGGNATVPVGTEDVVLSFDAARQPLPFEVKLLDFRKQMYPGLAMAESFESDVEIHDAAQGITLSKTISMNHPLRYRGYKIFQSGYQEGPSDASVFSVRNDPGVPLVYTGCSILVLGIALLFYWKSPTRKMAS